MSVCVLPVPVSMRTHLSFPKITYKNGYWPNGSSSTTHQVVWPICSWRKRNSSMSVKIWRDEKERKENGEKGEGEREKRERSEILSEWTNNRGLFLKIGSFYIVVRPKRKRRERGVRGRRRTKNFLVTPLWWRSGEEGEGIFSSRDISFSCYRVGRIPLLREIVDRIREKEAGTRVQGKWQRSQRKAKESCGQTV